MQILMPFRGLFSNMTFLKPLFDIFAWNLQNKCKAAFRTYITSRVFELGLKNKRPNYEINLALSVLSLQFTDFIHT